MKQKERLAICTNCTRRKIDFEHGYVCQLTGSAADFVGECKDFEKDETVINTIKVRTKPRPMVPLFDPAPQPGPKEKSTRAKQSAKAKQTTKAKQSKSREQSPKSKKPTGEALKKLRRYQSFFYAFFGGLLITVVSSLGWIVLTNTTGFQGVYWALGVGLLVGLSVRFFGAGIYRIFGVLAALLTLLGSLLGYYLSQTGFLEEVNSAGILRAPDYLNPEMILNTIQDVFVPLDLLFYGLAILLGYLLAIRRVNARKLERLESDAYKGAPVLYWIRLPLILVGFLLPAFYGYTMVKEDPGGVNTLYYDSGKKMSEGVLQNGNETGKWTYWYENGNIDNTGYYTDGLRDSLWQWYDESGNHISTGMYFQGKENGSWINYFADGIVSDSGAFLDGLKEGIWKYNYETGGIKSTVTYKAGKMHGEKILYNTSGKKVVVQNYENGLLAE